MTPRAVYVLSDATTQDGIRFVGSAYMSAEAEFAQLAADAEHGGDWSVHAWMRAAGVANVRMDVIDSFPVGTTHRQVKARATAWVWFLRTVKDDLLNRKAQGAKNARKTPADPPSEVPPAPLPAHLTAGFRRPRTPAVVRPVPRPPRPARAPSDHPSEESSTL